jgi:hypothetical protein
MGVDKIIKLVGVLVAVVAGLMGGADGVAGAFTYSGTLVALLGLAGGWFIAADDRMRFLVATAALVFVAAGALGTPEAGGDMVIPVIGDYISAALGGIAALFSAAAVTVIVMGTVDAVKP